MTLVQNWAQKVISSWSSLPNNKWKSGSLQRWNRRSLYIAVNKTRIGSLGLDHIAHQMGLAFLFLVEKNYFEETTQLRRKKSKFPPTESNLWLVQMCLDKNLIEHRFDSCWWDSDFFFRAACVTNLTTLCLMMIVSHPSLFSHKPQCSSTLFTPQNFAWPLFQISPGYYSLPKKSWKQWLFKILEVLWYCWHYDLSEYSELALKSSQ